MPLLLLSGFEAQGYRASGLRVCGFRILVFAGSLGPPWFGDACLLSYELVQSESPFDFPSRFPFDFTPPQPTRHSRRIISKILAQVPMPMCKWCLGFRGM